MDGRWEMNTSCWRQRCWTRPGCQWETGSRVRQKLIPDVDRYESGSLAFFYPYLCLGSDATVMMVVVDRCLVFIHFINLVALERRSNNFLVATEVWLQIGGHHGFAILSKQIVVPCGARHSCMK